MKRLTAAMALALSAMPVVIHADDWIGRIAGNAYITQLSIPGAHDAGTGYGFTGFTAQSQARRWP